MHFKHASSSPNESWTADLQMWAISQLASVWLIDLEPYEPCKVAGIPVRWRIDPARQRIEVVLFDGTASILARWSPIRRPSPMEAEDGGRGLVLEGVLTIDDEGSVVMLNPSFHRAQFSIFA